MTKIWTFFRACFTRKVNGGVAYRWGIFAVRARERSELRDWAKRQKAPARCNLKVIFSRSERYSCMQNTILLKGTQKRWLKRYCKEHSISLNIKSLEGIIYLLRTGCQWRLLPRHFGTWQTIYHSYRSWSERPWFGRMLSQISAHLNLFLSKDVGSLSVLLLGLKISADSVATTSAPVLLPGAFQLLLL